jgi:hypothetical protein
MKVEICSLYKKWTNFLQTVWQTIELIRRDSPTSPFFQRGMRKIHPNARQSEVRRYQSQHILKLSMGTPQVDIYAIADTRSDLIWTQCVPACPGCYNHFYPLFDPLKSSTYNGFSCQSI